MVLIGPALELDPNLASPFMKWLARNMSGWWPSFDKLPGIDPAAVTSDEAWQREIREDPMNYHGGFKARWTEVALSAIERLEMERVTAPFLVIHGAEDKIVEPAGSEELFRKSGSRDKQIVVLPGSRHNPYLEVEPIKTRAIEETFAWIDNRLSTKLVV